MPMLSSLLQLILGISLILLCCGMLQLFPHSPQPEVVLLPQQRVSVPQMDYQHLAWLDSERLVARIEAVDVDNPRRKWRLLWSLSLRDPGQVVQLDVPEPPVCLDLMHFHPQRLPDGRLGYAIFCGAKAISLWAYDLDTGEAERLRRNFLLERTGTGGPTWNPELTRGVMGDGARYIQEQLYFFDRDQEWTHIDVGLEQAYGPTWSPDGSTIAFMGQRFRNRPGPGGADPYALYVMDADGTNVRQVLGYFYASHGGNWSPDSQWVVLRGFYGTEYDEDGPAGLWLVEIETQRIVQILDGSAFEPVWSPDGQQVIAFLEAEGETTLVIIDVSSVVSP